MALDSGGRAVHRRCRRVLHGLACREERRRTGHRGLLQEGLAANQTIARSDRAAKLGLVAGIRFAGDVLSVRLEARDKDYPMPPTLAVTISHPTRAGLDQSRVLVRNGNLYTGELRLPAAGHWLLLLEDDPRTWRLMGNMILPANGETLIGSLMKSETATAPADIRH